MKTVEHSLSQYRAKPAARWEGVTTIPKGSRGKRPEVRDSRRKMAGEIVCSAWRHAAASQGAGVGVANHSEHLALLRGTTVLLAALLSNRH